MQRVLMSCGQAVTSTRALSSSSRNNTQQHSSNTRLERTSVSRFPSLAYCTAKKPTRDKQEHGLAKQSRAHENSAAAAVTPSDSRTTLDSSSTRTSELLLLF